MAFYIIHIVSKLKITNQAFRLKVFRLKEEFAIIIQCRLIKPIHLFLPLPKSLPKLGGTWPSPILGKGWMGVNL